MYLLCKRYLTKRDMYSLIKELVLASGILNKEWWSRCLALILLVVVGKKVIIEKWLSDEWSLRTTIIWPSSKGRAIGEKRLVDIFVSFFRSRRGGVIYGFHTFGELGPNGLPVVFIVGKVRIGVYKRLIN